MPQLLLDLLPPPPPSLDNFVPGDNADVLTGLVAWLSAGDRTDRRETSFLLWGEAGVGKTHLLRASGASYGDAASDPDLRGIDPSAELVAVDDVDRLSPDGQIALFNLFNRQHAAGRRLLASAEAPPQGLGLREDLRTRLGSGLIYRVRALSDDEAQRALQAQAATRGLALAPELFAYLATRAPRDMRNLTGILAALDRHSLKNKRAITLPLLREVLQVLRP